MEKMMEKQEAKKVGRRLVLVVYPFQGHINPMLQLATILNSKGFSITVMHPEFNSPNVSKHSHFTFVPIPDGLSKTNVSTENAVPTISALKKNCEDPLQRYLEQMLEAEDSHDRVACVVYDGLMHFAQVVADRLKLPALSVRTSAAASLLAFALIPHLHEQEDVSFQDFLSGDQVPELQSLMLKVKDQLVSMTRNPTALSELRAVADATKNASAIIVNTMHFLELQTLTKVSEHFRPPIFIICPFHKLAPSAPDSEFHLFDCRAWEFFSFFPSQ